MTEERKHAILLASVILTARRLQPLLEEDDKECKPNMGTEFWAEIAVKRAIERGAYSGFDCQEVARFTSTSSAAKAATVILVGYFSADILVLEIPGRPICESQWSQLHKTFVLCVNLCAGHLNTANRVAPKRHRR